MALGEIFTRDFLILSTINLAVFFGFQMLNVGLPMYVAQLGASGQIVGLTTTVMTVMATVMRIFTGALLDRFGRWGMLIGGTVIIVCAIVSFAVFPIVGVILGFRMLHGIGWGAGSTASSTIAADIIPKRRFAEGMGYFAMTTAIASAVAPAASVALVQGAGAVCMIYVSAGITMIALVLSIVEALIVRKHGLQAGADASETTPSHPQAPEGEQGRSRFETLFERRAFLPGALIFLVNIGFGCITTFIALHAEAQGVSGVSAYFLVYAVVTLASRPLIGKLIDAYGYRIPAILSTLCTAGTLAVIGISSSLWMFGLAGVLGGLGIGTAMGTYQAMAVASVEPWRRGVATSTYMTAFDMGIAVGSLFGGVIADFSSYTIMYFAVALSPVVASVISAVVIKPGMGSASSPAKPE